MRISKNRGLSLIAVFIILVVYNVITFVVPFERSGGFWIGYGFSILAILLTAGVGFYALSHESMKSKFYGLPLLRVTWIYLVIQVICGLIFMTFPVIPVWISVVISIILLGACLIGLIAVDIGKDEIVRVDNVIKGKVFYIKALKVDIDSLSAKTDDLLLGRSLKELSETIQYSDPMSSDQLFALEAKIEAKVAELRDAVDTRRVDDAKNLCSHIQQLFLERNKKCKLLK